MAQERLSAPPNQHRNVGSLPTAICAQLVKDQEAQSARVLNWPVIRMQALGKLVDQAISGPRL
jgi:hypothetical protein